MHSRQPLTVADIIRELAGVDHKLPVWVEGCDCVGPAGDIELNQKLLFDGPPGHQAAILITRFTEFEEATTKGMKKLREEVLEAVEQVETDGGDDGETLAFMKEQLREFKDLAKAVIGDDVTLEVMRKKFRGFIGGTKKNALAGGDDE